jgi:hypothetical protein
MTGCSTGVLNDTLSEGFSQSRYDFESRLPENDDRLLVVLSFSGGGTRAAALSYGVLDALRNERLDIDNQPTPLPTQSWPPPPCHPLYGITDNIGVRGSMMSPIAHRGEVNRIAGAFTETALDKVEKVLVILVKASSARFPWTRRKRPYCVSCRLDAFWWTGQLGPGHGRHSLLDTRNDTGKIDGHQESGIVIVPGTNMSTVYTREEHEAFCLRDPRRFTTHRPSHCRVHA